MSGRKDDKDKPRVDLFPWPAVGPVTRVLEFGAKKYAAHNWRQGFTRTRLLAAALRHILADLEGETFDPESGLPHLDHAACMILFAVALREMGRLEDDRTSDGQFCKRDDDAVD